MSPGGKKSLSRISGLGDPFVMLIFQCSLIISVPSPLPLLFYSFSVSAGGLLGVAGKKISAGGLLLSVSGDLILCYSFLGKSL